MKPSRNPWSRRDQPTMASGLHVGRQPTPGRPGLSALSMPPKKYLPSNTMVDFETKAACRAECDKRVMLLRRTKHTGDWGQQARGLADRLSMETHRQPVTTLASNLFVRDLRQRLLGNLHRLIDQERPEKVTFFTVVRKEWAIHPADLPNVSIGRWKRALRKNLADAGIDFGSGYLVAVFEASYDPIISSYQFHVHGVAVGDYVDAIDALRGRTPYKPWRSLPGIADCKRPVLVRPVAVKDMPRPAGYMLKSFWKLRNAGRAIRLQGDEDTRELLFLDQHRIEDLT